MVRKWWNISTAPYPSTDDTVVHLPHHFIKTFFNFEIIWDELMSPFLGKDDNKEVELSEISRESSFGLRNLQIFAQIETETFLRYLFLNGYYERENKSERFFGRLYWQQQFHDERKSPWKMERMWNIVKAVSCLCTDDTVVHLPHHLTKTSFNFEIEQISLEIENTVRNPVPKILQFTLSSRIFFNFQMLTIT